MPNPGSRLIGAASLGRAFSVHNSSIQYVQGEVSGPVSLSLPHMYEMVMWLCLVDKADSDYNT